MEDRTGIFAGDDPIALARQWLAAAGETEINDPNAMALATVDQDGMPNVRVVLLKEIEADGFVFYTNFESQKGVELAANPMAAVVLHWKSLRRQVRVRGPVERVEGAQADAYYASRPLRSRIGAWASKQSRPLASRGELETAVAKKEAELGENPERPPHWGGYRLIPHVMEFWADGNARLHDRFHWSREKSGDSWAVTRLNP